MHKITFEAVIDLTTPAGAAMLQELVLMKKPDHSLSIIDESAEAKPITVAEKKATTKKETTKAQDPVKKEPQQAVEEPQQAVEEPQQAVEEPQQAVEEPQQAEEILDFSHSKPTIDDENRIRELQRAKLTANPANKPVCREKLNSYGADSLTQLFEKSPEKVAEYENFLKAL